MMRSEIYLGECSAVMAAKIPDASIDLTVTSPPYDNLRSYNGYTFDFEAIARQLWRVTKLGGVVVWVVADETKDGSETLTSFRHALHFRSLGFNVETMIYEVAGTGAKGSNYLYWQAFEYMFVLIKGRPKSCNRIADRKNIKVGQVMRSAPKSETLKTRSFGDRVITLKDFGVRTNIWRYHTGTNGGDITDHPAPFPENLVKDHILSWSNPGDFVLDPFVGSGTTGKMAKLLHRNFIGIDISEEYCNLATRRIAQAQAPAITEEGIFVQPEQASLFEAA